MVLGMETNHSNNGDKMSNAAKYSITGTSIANVTLHTAVSALAAMKDRTDATHIRRGSRAVAFACNWRGVVRPMFGANGEERHILNSWGWSLAA